jgi:hypothetical protein
MASTYTANNGIEKIGSGEQSGTWGNTTNTNFDIIDRILNGVGTISLSGTTHTLTTTDGSLTDGMYKVLVLGGSPSGTNTITVSPNDQDKVFIVQNGSGEDAIFSQGSGANVTVPDGSKKIIYCDGAGSGAAVVDVTSSLDISSLRIGGTAITSTGAELNIIDGGTSATSTTVVDADRVVFNDDGTMKQVAVTDMSTYYNANAFDAPSAITSTGTLTPSSAKSIYQRVDCTSGNITLTLAEGSLAVGQYIVVDKIDTSSNTLTLAYPTNSQGLSLGNAVEFASAFYQGSSKFSFIETVKS